MSGQISSGSGVRQGRAPAGNEGPQVKAPEEEPKPKKIERLDDIYEIYPDLDEGEGQPYVLLGTGEKISGVVGVLENVPIQGQSRLGVAMIASAGLRTRALGEDGKTYPMEIHEGQPVLVLAHKELARLIVEWLRKHGGDPKVLVGKRVSIQNLGRERDEHGVPYNYEFSVVE